MERFKPGDRVHWFKYSFEGIIIDGGYGIVIRRIKSLYNTCMFEILIDGGELKMFSHIDLDLVKWNYDSQER